MSTTVEQIKDRLNIVEVVGQYVKLTKSGKNYKALSPFKKEKTPSFYVSPDRGMYYCFSSQKGGDIFSFVQEMEGVDFRGALKILADKAGVVLTHERREERDDRERQYNILDETTAFFEARFKEKSDAADYLKVRGVTEESMTTWRIGFALPEWDKLRAHLRQKGYNDVEMERVGLVKKGDRGSYYDRFRSRIMFPISDSAGRVIAFSGRIFGEAARDKENAKYLNSPETPLFDKSRVLYGYDKARQVIRKYDFSIIVEGQMDLVLSHQAGFHNTVAASGTGLTEAHLELLSRLSMNVVMAFDADSAGIASAGRAARMALAKGMDVKVAELPPGVDPADLIQEDPSKWNEAIRKAVHVVNFYLDIISREEKDPRKRALRANETVLPFVCDIENKIDQAHFITVFANTLGVPEDAVREEIRKQMREKTSQPASREEYRQPESGTTKILPARRRIETLERMLAGIHFLDGDDSVRSEIPLSIEFLRITGSTLEERAVKYHDEREQLKFEVDLILHDTNVQDILTSLLKDYELEVIKERLGALSLEHGEAERSGDEARAQEVLQDLRELSKKKMSLET